MIRAFKRLFPSAPPSVMQEVFSVRDSLCLHLEDIRSAPAGSDMHSLPPSPGASSFRGDGVLQFPFPIHPDTQAVLSSITHFLEMSPAMPGEKPLPMRNVDGHFYTDVPFKNHPDTLASLEKYLELLCSAVTSSLGTKRSSAMRYYSHELSLAVGSNEEAQIISLFLSGTSLAHHHEISTETPESPPRIAVGLYERRGGDTIKAFKRVFGGCPQPAPLSFSPDYAEALSRPAQPPNLPPSYRNIVLTPEEMARFETLREDISARAIHAATKAGTRPDGDEIAR